ncbi:hypothetical protein [Candidatus Tisiphia endosymbiont of Metellina segmentata]|uniref:hypothetical protein n=1 Tax=Candidatus Tisiphia endosymbiont of Metellina segmentata TaxID=3066274 RepID=UPI00313BFCB3
MKRCQQRREDLVLMLSNEKKRLHHSIDGIDKESIEKLIKFLQNEIAELDKKSERPRKARGLTVMSSPKGCHC